MWLRTLPECPEMFILKTLPDAWPKCPEVNAVETAYILAARREWPGRMLNVLPWPPEGSPEFDVWDEMARLDDPNFVRSEEYLSQTELVKALWDDPEFRAMKSASVKAQWADPEFHAEQTARLKAQWDDPKYRAIKSAEMKALWDDPEFRAMKLAGLKAQWDDPEFRAMQLAATKARWEDPEFRARQSAGVVYGSLKGPCRGCGCPPLEFADDCDRCRKRRQHPYLAERLREAS